VIEPNVARAASYAVMDVAPIALKKPQLSPTAATGTLKWIGIGRRRAASR
jgi:hypothetical protein